METGLYYYGARYYDANIGRFISADTKIDGRGLDTQGYNRYTYARNNPIVYSDPSGHDGWNDFWAGVNRFLNEVGRAIDNTIRNNAVLFSVLGIIITIVGVVVVCFPGLQAVGASIATFGVGLFNKAYYGIGDLNITYSMEFDLPKLWTDDSGNPKKASDYSDDSRYIPGINPVYRDGSYYIEGTDILFTDISYDIQRYWYEKSQIAQAAIDIYKGLNLMGEMATGDLITTFDPETGERLYITKDGTVYTENQVQQLILEAGLAVTVAGTAKGKTEKKDYIMIVMINHYMELPQKADP